MENLHGNPVLLWVYCIQQELTCYNTIAEHIPKNKPLLKITALDTHLQHIAYLLNWVRKELVNDTFESVVLDTIYKKYKPIHIILYKHDTSKWIYKDSYRKCELLANIVKYIKGILVQHVVITNTLELIEDIQKRIKQLATPPP